MDNQENETFTPPEVTATLLPPNRDTWSGGLDAASETVALSSNKPSGWTNTELVMVLRNAETTSVIGEALARLLESDSIARTADAIEDERLASVDYAAMSNAELVAHFRDAPYKSAVFESQARLLEALPPKSSTKCVIPAMAVAHTIPTLSQDKWLSSLQSMPLADLAAELSEEGALRYRGLLWRAHEAMQAFTDPEGNMPEQTGEFLELKLIMLELEAALGI